MWPAVSLRAPSIMLAMSGIWLIGCQFTRSDEVMRDISTDQAVTGSGAMPARRRGDWK
jgi:hypothetical protein